MQVQALTSIFPTDIEDLIGGNPIDSPFKMTLFDDLDSKVMTTRDSTLRELKSEFDTTPVTSKNRQHLIKVATFGDVRTIKGALRHDGNLISVNGIEGDHDAGTMTIDHAVDLLRAAGVVSLVHPTASSTPDKNRWRVIAPFSSLISPGEREALAARLNGVLKGALHPESFVASQAFYFGKTDPNAVATLIDGVMIDRLPHLQDFALGKDGKPFASRATQLLTQPIDSDEDLAELEIIFNAPDWPRIIAALAFIPVANAEAGDVSYNDWLTVGMALHAESRGDDKGFIIWDEWSKPGKGYESRGMRRKWEGFDRATGKREIGSMFHLARVHGWNSLTPKPREPSSLTLLLPSECSINSANAYRVKGLIADGDVGCIYGAPGAGKSLVAPHIGYAVAQGREVFGMRTRKGPVLYVAAEDSRGMERRVRALHDRHGDAPGFTHVGGVSDLLKPDSSDLAALLAVVADRKPALIFIDTLAIAFPGLEENSAEGMGRVVAVARSLTSGGAAVILIHHDTKEQTPTPRGHSLFNGALDMALQLIQRDETGVIRGRMSKNRNGSCDRDIAFKIDVQNLGTDDDGDDITVALVDELAAGAAPQGPKLTASERAALSVLDNMGGTVGEEAWRKACRDGRSVSGADTNDARRMATNRAIKGLVTKGIVIVINEQATRYCDEANSFEGFDQSGAS